MKHLSICLFATLLLAGCTTTSKYVSKTDAGPAKPADYPIYVYTEDVIVPRPSEVIGTMHVGDTPFTVMGGSVESVLNKLINNARKKGADAVQITSIEKPGFVSPNHRVDANFLRFTDTWESIPRSEVELKHYFKTNAPKLDPIEGIWRASDLVQTRAAILKNNSKPGREFIAVLLEARNPTWKPGDKKADIRRGERPGVYRGGFYREDYQEKRIVIKLQLPSANQFALSVEGVDPLVFVRE
jgi:hypothetical protein